jgi:hypothetical protein
VLTVVDQFVFRGCEVVAGAVEPAVVVPVGPLPGGQFDAVEPFPGAAVVDEFRFLNRPISLSASALSNASPTEPTLGATPTSARRWVNALEVYYDRASL